MTLSLTGTTRVVLGQEKVVFLQLIVPQADLRMENRVL